MAQDNTHDPSTVYEQLRANLPSSWTVRVHARPTTDADTPNKLSIHLHHDNKAHITVTACQTHPGYRIHARKPGDRSINRRILHPEDDDENFIGLDRCIDRVLAEALHYDTNAVFKSV